MVANFSISPVNFKANKELKINQTRTQSGLTSGDSRYILKKPLSKDTISFTGAPVIDLISKNKVLFQGALKKLEDARLFGEFKDFAGAEPDKIFEFVKNCNASPSHIKEFLHGVTSDDRYSNQFINQVTANPGDSQDNINCLMQKMGSEKDYLSWYFAPGGYVQANDKFNQKFFNEAQSIEDLLRRQPNWTIWRIKEKYQQLHGNSNFVIGDVPQQFGGRDSFYHLTEQLRNYSSDQLLQKELNGKIYHIKPLPSGLSDKKSFIVSVDNKKFVLKLDKNPGHRNETEENKENKALKSDSVFINAAIDYYLNANGCPNATKVYYYDYYNNAALYEFVDGKSLELPGMTSDRLDIVETNRKLTDLNSLGIFTNDVNKGNFKQTADSQIKMIDSGESSFVDGLKPGSMGYHSNMPNLCGQDLSMAMFSMYLAKSGLLK